EFIGRLPVIATLNDLDEATLIDILSNPKNALVKQYSRLFEMENVGLEFTPEALQEIAKKALERKTGARGLRSIMESILLDPMFDMPGSTDIEKVVVSGDVVKGKEKPQYVKGPKKTAIEGGKKDETKVESAIA